MMKELWVHQFYHNTLADWLVAALTTVGVALVLRLIKVLVVKRLRRTAPTTDTIIDDFVLDISERTSGFFQLAMGVLAATSQLDLPDRADARIHTAVILISILQGGLWGNGVLQFLIVGFIDRRAEPGDVSYRTGKSMLRFAGMALVWSAVTLLFMENVGINISTLVTGLGVTGVAVAFATQNILSDLIASVSLILDKPFMVGDFIIADAYIGTIEKIGIRSTRMRSLSGEGINIPNSDLSKSRVRNYKSLQERRILFNFSVKYETPQADIEAIPGMVKEIIQSIAQTRFDRAHLMVLGESALQYEVVYFVLVPDYNIYCGIAQQINLALLKRFGERGIGFAYRTQVSYTYALGAPPTSQGPTQVSAAS